MCNRRCSHSATNPLCQWWTTTETTNDVCVCRALLGSCQNYREKQHKYVLSLLQTQIHTTHLCCTKCKQCSGMGNADADSIIIGPNETQPTSSHGSASTLATCLLPPVLPISSRSLFAVIVVVVVVAVEAPLATLRNRCCECSESRDRRAVAVAELDDAIMKSSLSREPRRKKSDSRLNLIPASLPSLRLSNTFRSSFFDSIISLMSACRTPAECTSADVEIVCCRRDCERPLPVVFVLLCVAFVAPAAALLVAVGPLCELGM